MIRLKLSSGFADVSEHNPPRQDAKAIEEALEIYSGFAQRQGYSPSNPLVLISHGNDIGGKYVYFDRVDGSRVYRPVQEWVNVNDGSHDALFVTACNPQRRPLNSASCPVVYPNGMFHGSIMFDDVLCGLVTPEDLGLLLISKPE